MFNYHNIIIFGLSKYNDIDMLVTKTFFSGNYNE